MTYLIIALIIAILFAFMFLCEVYQQDRQIKQLKRECDESLNTVNYYRRMVDGFRDKMREEEEKYELVQAHYCTSDSDLIKYNSREAMEKAIRKNIAANIAQDILSRFEPGVLPLGEGKKKYSLILKVKKI